MQYVFDHLTRLFICSLRPKKKKIIEQKNYYGRLFKKLVQNIHHIYLSTVSKVKLTTLIFFNTCSFQILSYDYDNIRYSYLGIGTYV